MAEFYKLVRKTPAKCTWAFSYYPYPGAKEKEIIHDGADGRFPTKRDAQRYHAEITTAAAGGTYIDPKLGRETFRSFYVRWSYVQPWATGTRDAYATAVKCATFADIPLRDINAQDIDKWLAKMARDGLAVGTRRTRIRNLKAAFKGAGPDGWKLIPGNPMANVKMPGKGDAKAVTIHAVERGEIPTPEVVGQWVNGANGQFKALFALCAFAGLRGGEACGMQLGDFDFRGRTLKIARQATRARKDQDGVLVETWPGSRVEIKPPKYNSVRTISVSADFLMMINAHVAEFGTLGDEQWLFRSGRRNYPPTGSAIERAIINTRVAVPAVADFHTHSLRHYYASGLIDARCGIPEVMEAMGHANQTTTLNTYVHLFKGAEDRTRAAMAGMMAAAFAETSEPRADFAERLRSKRASSEG